MIIIADDTFIDRYKFHDVDYLNEPNYSKVCKLLYKIKTIDIEDIEKRLPFCEFFCNHKTLQLYDVNDHALDNDNNRIQRENLLNKVTLANIQRIEFSRGLETNIEVKKIDKDLFYSNLKAFLDFFIEKNEIEPKILFWGENFKERERMSIIQMMLIQIRMLSIDAFLTNAEIIKGLHILYPQQNAKEIIERWRKIQLTKSDIITEINNQIH